MRGLLLTRSPEAHGNRRLAETAAARGWDLSVVDSLAPMVVASSGEVLLEGEPLRGIDAVLPRFGPELQAAGLVVLRALEANGARTLSPAEAFARARDKIAAIAAFRAAGLAVPETAIVSDPAQAEAAFDAVNTRGAGEVVIKPARGWAGKGLELFAERAAAVEYLRQAADARTPLLVQAYVRECRGLSMRILVVDGEIVASALFEAAGGDFRANAAAGASGARLEAEPRFREAALTAVACLGLRAGAVDLLPTSTEPRVLEVNAAPGFRLLEELTGVDVATALLEALERP